MKNSTRNFTNISCYSKYVTKTVLCTGIFIIVSIFSEDIFKLISSLYISHLVETTMRKYLQLGNYENINAKFYKRRYKSILLLAAKGNRANRVCIFSIERYPTAPFAITFQSNRGHNLSLYRSRQPRSVPLRGNLFLMSIHYYGAPYNLS